MFAPRGGGGGAYPLTPTRVYTNPLISNLTFLCAYHNSIDDDDPKRPTGRGYMFRLNTGITYIPPWGVPITAMPEYQAIARLAAEQQADPPPAQTPTAPPEQPPPDSS